MTTLDLSLEAPLAARVLLVEDDLTQSLVLNRMTARIVSEVRSAENGERGLELWRQWKPDVVVTDIHMPKLSGLELAAIIKREEPDAQLVILTSDLSDESLIEALRLGVDRYITKPIDFNLLADAIRKCLRDRVHLRELQLTREISALNAALQAEKTEHLALIRRLEEAHNQLLQAEKMASIGQLAAGIAHEINTPVGFITSNLGALRQYVDQISRLLDAYEKSEPEVTTTTREALIRLKKEIDLHFLQEDLACVLNESLSGLGRVKKIVQSLSDFAQGGATDFRWHDIHQCLEDALGVTAHELNNKVQITRDYGNLPKIECVPGELNQVFMNLLINAAQAIPECGNIVIRTTRKDDFAIVEIIDDGDGIPADITHRIFDPFFTTKPVGIGSGLGLSVSHGIISKHNGRIEVESTPGKGSTFRVSIPFRHPAGAPAREACPT